MKDLNNWPRVIQLAWVACNEGRGTISQGNHLIRPDGWTIPDGSDGKDATFWIEHGFNTQKSLKEGVPIREAAELFVRDLQDCTYMISHNMDYDYNVLGSELIRLELKSERRPVRICTKETSTNFCAIPFEGRRYPGSRQRYKWPKLAELHLKLFGFDFEDAHDAMGDVFALKKCFFQLLELGVIKLPRP